MPKYVKTNVLSGKIYWSIYDKLMVVNSVGKTRYYISVHVTNCMINISDVFCAGKIRKKVVYLVNDL